VALRGPEGLGILKVDERQHAVVLLQTDLENAGHLKSRNLGTMASSAPVPGIMTVTSSPTPTCS